jgi:hypothetical protein
MYKTEHSLDLSNQKNYNKETHLGPYWKRMHRDWRVWVGIALVAVALSIYIISVDFTIQPATTEQVKP